MVILLVEDNQFNRDMLARRLKRAGFTLATATNGLEALIAVDQHQPDLIVMDMEMPELDGWDTTAYLKSLPITRHIPIIALTGHASEDACQRCFKAGCDAFMTKPCDFAMLLSTIAALVPHKGLPPP